MEPTASASAAYGISKIWYAIGGAFGSGALGAVWQPAALSEYGKFTKGLIIGGIGAGAPVMVGGLLAIQLGLDPHSADVGMAIGTAVGLSAVGLIVFAANYFKKRESMDIIQVAQEAKAVAKGVPAKKVARKRPARKTAK